MSEEDWKRYQAAVAQAITHIVQKGVDDIFHAPVFAPPLELDILRAHEDDFRTIAAQQAERFLKQANLKQAPVNALSYSLIPKDHKSFRNVAWIDPFDAVKFLSLALLMFEKIEDARLPIEKQILHSHRRSIETSSIFNPDFGYDTFRSRSGQLARDNEGKWRVITDLSNFFDRISIHSLENHLLELKCPPRDVTLLREMLLHWGGDRRSFGIPVGSDASRILSEAVFVDVDAKLNASGIQFLRYVDDYRIFCDTRAEAYDAVQFLTTLLLDEGLALNSRKTEVRQIVGSDDPRLDANRFAAEEHKVIDEGERVEVTRRIRVSGRPHISRYYREPGKDALKKIRELNKGDLLKQFEEAPEGQTEDLLKLLVKYFVYADQDVSILEIAIAKRVTAVFYISDALIKERKRFSDEKCVEIVRRVLSSFDWHKAPYPYQIPVLRLFAAENFAYATLSCDLLDRHRIADNAVFFRELVRVSYGNLNRSRLRRLAREVFYQTAPLVQRAIFFAVKNSPVITDDERRPLLKTMKEASQDWFIQKL